MPSTTTTSASATGFVKLGDHTFHQLLLLTGGNEPRRLFLRDRRRPDESWVVARMKWVERSGPAS